jgi:glucose dehydrogenase
LQFNFKIVYCPGTAGGKLDALTRRSGDLPKEGDDHSVENQTTIIKPENILHASTATPSNQPDILLALDAPTLNRLFHEAYATDPFPNKVLQMLRDSTKQCKDITLAECEERNNLLLYR